VVPNIKVKDQPGRGRSASGSARKGVKWPNDFGDGTSNTLLLSDVLAYTVDVLGGTRRNVAGQNRDCGG